MITRLATAAGLALPAAAASPQALAQAAAPSVIGTSQIFGLFAGTLFVLAVIAGAAWLFKRFSPRGYGAGGVLRVVAGAAVGQRERVVIVEIGSQWLVLGVAPGSVNFLREIPRTEIPEPAAMPLPSTQFATWLKQMMEKRNGK